MYVAAQFEYQHPIYYNSVGRAHTWPDFQGPMFEFRSVLSLFLPSLYMSIAAYISKILMRNTVVSLLRTYLWFIEQGYDVHVDWFIWLES